MKDKDRYKRAFNTLVSSNVFENEEDILKMTETNKVKKGFFKASTVAAALLAVLLVGSVTVYAADKDGAYFLYEMACSEDDYELLTVGQAIMVTGYKGEWAGEVEIVDATFEIVEGSYVAEAVDVLDSSVVIIISCRPEHSLLLESQIYFCETL